MTDPLEQEIADTREHLAQTVDALTAKAETGAKRGAVAVPVLLAVLVGLLVWRRRH